MQNKNQRRALRGFFFFFFFNFPGYGYGHCEISPLLLIKHLYEKQILKGKMAGGEHILNLFLFSIFHLHTGFAEFEGRSN